MPRPPRTLALVLAGGEGSRLGPLTQRRAKPALPFAGTYRLIDFALTNCVHSRLSDVWVLEQYRPHALNDHLLNGRPWDLDRNRGGLRILPPFAGGRGAGFAVGNAEAIWRQRELLAQADADELVVLSADHVERVDLRDVLARHREARARVTMVTTEVPVAEASRFGVVRVAPDGRVRDFAYKPDEPEGDGFRATVTTEVLAYDLPHLLRTLDRLAAEVGPREGEEGEDGEPVPDLRDFGDHLLPALVDEGRAHAVPHEGYWRDVGTVDSYWQGHMDLLGDEPSLRLDDPAWPVRTAGELRMPARVSAGGRAVESLLAPGARVLGTVERSVVGPGVVIEEGAHVRDAVLLHDAVVRGGAHVVRAIVDERVEVGARATVGGDRPADADDEAIVVIGRATHVRAGERVGAGERRDAARGHAGANGPASRPR